MLLAAVLAAALAGGSAGAGETTKMERTPETAGRSEVSLSLLPIPASPLLTFRIEFRVGSIDDPRGKEGLNALTALTIGQGGTKDLTYREVTDRLYPMAASIHAQPDREVTTFVGEVHRDHLRGFYQILTDLILKPRFDPADFGRVRDNLVAQIETNLRGSDDEGLGKETLNWMMYEGLPAGHPNIGTVQGLKGITLEEVKAFYGAHYTRDQMIIGLAGGYQPGLVDALREDFAALSIREQERLPPARPRPIEQMEVVLIDKPAPATAISIGCPIGVTRSDHDFYALMVANSALGEHRTFNGRLQNRMRGDRGLNYGDYSYIENFVQDGGSTFPMPNVPRHLQHFSLWIRPVARDNALFALRQATRELQRLIDAGLTADEFEQTRAYLLNYSRLWTQSLSRRLGYLLDSKFYGTDFFIDRIQAELPRLTLAEVNAAVKRHLTARNLMVAIVTDRAAEMRDLLLSGKPTPITYQTPTTREGLLKEDKEIEAYPLPLNRERVRVVKAQDMFER